MERGAHIAVRGAQQLLADGERALVGELGVGIAAQRAIDQAQIVEPGGHIDMLGTMQLLGEPHSPLGNSHRFGVLAGLRELNNLTIERDKVIRGLSERRGRTDRLGD